ncbi:hypothetical protein [Pseudomonas japonica]|uniref:hypothetical protein n=1 Tax=Pseudomonas japonica TaxID=256466 RepID=UPI003A8820C0
MSSCERMAPDQIARLALAICATAEALGQTITPKAAEVMADDLADFAPGVVADALKTCRRELTGRLTMGAIMQCVRAADGRPGKDEAWAMALTASDESETVVLTEEIHQAMTAARPVLERGDKVGARMAFMSAYERLVAHARLTATQPSWRVSLGFDPCRRVIAIETAVRSRLIGADVGQQYLADLQVTPITQDGQAIAGLLTGETVHATAKVREKLAGIRALLDQGNARRDRLARKKGQRDRVSTYLLKRRVRQAIANAVIREAGEGSVE